MSEAGNHLLLGVSGSIAALRAPDLAARLRHEGFEVQSILTKSAEQFVTPASLAVMSRGKVYTSTDALSDVWHPAHIELADWADIALVAPATAATIARLAHGMATGLLAETFLALGPNVRQYLAPAMNGHMLSQPAVERNIAQLEEDGYRIITPRIGELACGYEGQGKLAELGDIVQIIAQAMD